MIKAIITDIEGTTSSLSFVKDCLFPYARAHVGEFCRANSENETVQKLLEDVNTEVGTELDLEQAIHQLIQWIDEDKKITPLKSLQGLIWESGYQRGELIGHLYEDAIRHLQNWKAEGFDLYVYSSGSVYAQKLLFAHTDAGDLTPLFSGYFDTHIGGKQDSNSYENIVAHIGLPAEQLLFLSDIEGELNAAQTAGLQTIWLVRDNDAPQTEVLHRQVRDFDEIELERFAYE
jgi:enolase-phosphatase E1